MLDIQQFPPPLQEAIIARLQEELPFGGYNHWVAWLGSGAFTSVVFARFTVHQMSSYENDTDVGMGWGNSCMITRRSPDYISARYGRINRPTGEVWLSQESPSGYFIPPGHPNYATAMVFFQSLLHEVLVPLRCATVTELIECQRAALLDQPNKPVYRIPSLETWHHDLSETWHPGSEYPYNRGVFDFDGINHIVVSHGPNATYFAYDDGWEIERCVVS